MTGRVVIMLSVRMTDVTMCGLFGKIRPFCYLCLYWIPYEKFCTLSRKHGYSAYNNLVLRLDMANITEHQVYINSMSQLACRSGFLHTNGLQSFSGPWPWRLQTQQSSTFSSFPHTYTHTCTYKHTCSPACPATPDDWLFVCVEEFTLRCVQGNWLPVVRPVLSSPSLASLQRFVWYCGGGRGLEGIFKELFSDFVLSNGRVICYY